MSEEINVRGTYEQMIFFAEDNNFSIIRIQLETPLAPFEIGDELIVTGHFQQLVAGTSYEFAGVLVDHVKYGNQFQAISALKTLPKEEENILRYLKNLKIKGIGAKTFSALYTFLGEDMLQRITEGTVAVFDGFSHPRWTEEKAQRLSEAIKAEQGTQAYFFTLIKMGFASHIVVSLQQTYGDELPQIIETDIYQLIDKFDGISLRMIDDIAQNFFIEQLPKRLYYAIIYHIKQHCYKTGSSVVTKDAIFAFFAQERAFTYAQTEIEATIDQLIKDKKLFFSAGVYALDFFYYTEQLISGRVRELGAETAAFSAHEPLIDQYIAECEYEFGITYAAPQLAAIKQALVHPLFLMSGGPGTGKTTIIRAILTIYQQLSKAHETDLTDEKLADRIALLAPTGRAAQRMQETSGLSAKTIHRFLGWDLQTNSYRYNEDNPIKTVEFIIVDEASMLDMWVLSSLLKAVPHLKQLIFVGDADQLPSVGCGQCFSDLLQSDHIPHARLTHIFRQKEASTIIDVANSINAGRKTDLYFTQSTDYNFLPLDAHKLAAALTTITQNALNKGYDMYDIQVLAPLYKGTVGIDAINTHLQRVFNPDIYDDDERFVNHAGMTFLPNDKIIQLKNLPDFDVYNGDIGKISSITHYGKNEYEVEVSFNNNTLVYTKEEMKQVRLAYCISIHKSQGSEFKLIIMPIFSQYSIMLYRQLLYTGVSRAKKALIIIGNEQAFMQGIANNRADERKTLLRALLREDAQDMPETLIEALERRIVGEALDGQSPWDFL